VSLVHTAVGPTKVLIGAEGSAVLAGLSRCATSTCPSDFRSDVGAFGRMVSWAVDRLVSVDGTDVGGDDGDGDNEPLATARAAGRAVAAQLTSSTHEQPTAAQAVRLPWFRDARTVPGDWIAAHCVVSAHCGGAACSSSRGLACRCDHFLCLADLRALLQARVEDGAAFRCPQPGCSSPPYTGAELATRLPPADFAAWMSLRDRRIESTLARDMQAHLDRQWRPSTRQPVRASLSVGDEEALARAHCDRIVEDIVNLRCPACRLVFADFDGCLALTCASAVCRAHFCAWCLVQFDNDAETHTHVPTCPWAPPGHTDLFAPLATWQRAMERRQRRLVAEYLREHEPGVRVRVLVHRRLQQLA